MSNPTPSLENSDLQEQDREKDDGDFQRVLEQTTHLFSTDLTLNINPHPPGEEREVFFLLAAKLFSRNPVGTNVLRKIFQKAWRVRHEWTVEEVKPSIFKFRFRTEEDRQYVMVRNPWSINGAQLVFRDWEPDKLLEEVDLNKCIFWVRCHGVPPEYISEFSARQIGPIIGKYIFNERKNNDSIRDKNYLRLKVEVDLQSPLVPGFFLDRGTSKSVWIQFKYEHLANVCYKCGVLGHDQKLCLQEEPTKVDTPDQTEVTVYGPWIKHDSLQESCFSQIVAKPRVTGEDIPSAKLNLSKHSPTLDVVPVISTSDAERQALKKQFQRQRSDRGEQMDDQPTTVQQSSEHAAPSQSLKSKALGISDVKHKESTATKTQKTTVNSIPKLDWAGDDRGKQAQTQSIANSPNPSSPTEMILGILNPILESIRSPQKSCNLIQWYPNPTINPTQMKRKNVESSNSQADGSKRSRTEEEEAAQQTTTFSDWRQGEILKLAELFRNSLIQPKAQSSQKNFSTDRRIVGKRQRRNKNAQKGIQIRDISDIRDSSQATETIPLGAGIHKGTEAPSSQTTKAEEAGQIKPPTPPC